MGFRGPRTQGNFSGKGKCFPQRGVRSRPTSEAGGEVWAWLDAGGPSKVRPRMENKAMEVAAIALFFFNNIIP